MHGAVVLSAVLHRIAAAALVAVAAAGCAAGDGGLTDDGAETRDDDEGTLRASLSERLPMDALDTFAERTRWIETYGVVPAACVDRRDAADGHRALFHGCYDWHSSVHAHFAVYRMDLAGSGQRRALAERIDDRLVSPELDRVASELAADVSYENPYGRAWLLRLVTEHEAWNIARAGEPSTRLRALGDGQAKVLLDAFRTRAPDARRADYRSDAWTLAQVLAYARATRNDALATEAERLVREGLGARPLTWAETNDDDPAAFFSTYWSSVYALALAYEDDPAHVVALLAPGELPDDALTPLPDPGVAADVHHLGINWSRAWAIKALARRASAALGAAHPTTRRLVAAYHQHVLAGRERHLRYRGDYFAYDHWVPQFAVYAITDGDPAAPSR